jgi:hypothetical protein
VLESPRDSAFRAATGHVWEAVAYVLRARGERYVVVNPLATYRVREARRLSREKTDRPDAQPIAELGRPGLVMRTLVHQLYGLFPEFLGVGPICGLRAPWPSSAPA